MQLIIDKENLISLANHQEKNIQYEDILRMIKRHLSISCNFTKDDLGNDEILYASFVAGQFQDNNKLSFSGKSIPPRPLKSNYFIDPNLRRSILLINDSKIPEIKKRCALLLGGVGEEIETLKILFLGNADYRFERKFRIKDSDFNTWAKLKPFFCAQTDIILVDNFLFDDPSLLDSNCFEILRNIHSLQNIETKIVVFTKMYIETGGNKIPIDFSQIRKEIMSCVKKITGVNPKITFVTPSVKIKHDRNLLTNYVWINSGDTFNYFNSSSKIISKGDSFSVSSLVESETIQVADDIIQSLQNIIDSNPKNIIGDKESNFFTF